MDADAKGVLIRCQRLFNEALPKFNWGASFLDANAINLLNEVPAEVSRFLRKENESSVQTTLQAEAAKYRHICKLFDGMKTSTSERFLEALGAEDADPTRKLDDILTELLKKDVEELFQDPIHTRPGESLIETVKGARDE